MSNTEPNDEELTPAGLRRNRLTLAFKDGQWVGQDFQSLLNDNDPSIPSERWARVLQGHRKPPSSLDNEEREAWEAGFANGRHAGPDGELSPSPYLETKGAAKT